MRKTGNGVHDGVMEAVELIVDENRPASAGRFFQLGFDLLALLDELSDVPVAWRIDDLRTGSAVARVASPPGTDDGRWLHVVVDSLAAVQRGAALPEHWSPDAVRGAHRFVEHGQRVEGEDAWVPPRLVLVGGTEHKSVDLDEDLSQRLADVQPFERRMPGSVRGELVGLNVSRGNRASVRVANRRIVRVGFETGLRDSLKDALYKDVEISGLVRQDGDGRVFHVKAEGVQVLVTPDARWTDIIGMNPEYLRGVPVDEWLEANRGEA